MALIDGSIKKHLKAQIGDCNRELLELTNQLEEVHLSLNIVNKIKTCYDAVEEGNNCISAGRCRQKTCFQKLQKMIIILQVDRWKSLPLFLSRPGDQSLVGLGP